MGRWSPNSDAYLVYLRGDRSQALELNRKACSANIGALDRTADFIFDEDDIEVEEFEL